MARILVIDDDRSLLKMMKLMLEKAGHETILAMSGREGIQSAIDERPDLAIVDVMMPELSGYDVCRQLRENPVTAKIPLLILTARAQTMDRQMAADAGADDFVTKPVTREDLIEHVSELLKTGATNIPVSIPDLPPTPVAPEPAEAPITDIFLGDQPPPPAEPAPVAWPSPEGAFVTLPITAVMGLRGGSGATTVAVNLGLGMMQHGRACVIDLSDVSGHVAVQLQMLPPSATWLNLVNAGPRPEPNQIGASLMMHPSGVAVLAAPSTRAPQRPSPDMLQHVFEVLSEGFRRIVVDLPAQIDPASEAVLRMATHLLLVVSDDVAILQSATESLHTINALGLTARSHIILNHSRPEGVSFRDAERALGRAIEYELPYEPNQVAAIAQGTPLVMLEPGSVFSQTIIQIARAL